MKLPVDQLCTLTQTAPILGHRSECIRVNAQIAGGHSLVVHELEWSMNRKGALKQSSAVMHSTAFLTVRRECSCRWPRNRSPGPGSLLLPPVTHQYGSSVWTMRNIWSAPTAVGNIITAPPPPPAGIARAQWDAPPPTPGDPAISEAAQMVELPPDAWLGAHARTQPIIHHFINSLAKRLEILSVDNAATNSVTTIAPPGEAVLYSKTQYKRDAVYILRLIQEILDGHFTHCVPFLRESDYATARAVATCIDETKQAEFSKAAQTVLDAGTHAGRKPDIFQRFIEGFRAGPSAADREPSLEHQAGPSSLKGKTAVREQPEQDIHTDLRSSRPRSHHTDSSNLSRASGSPDDSSDPSDSNPDGKASHRRSRRHHSRHYRPRRRSSSRPEPTTRLKAEDVQLFDPKKGPVVSFTKRLKQMAKLYGKQSVLDMFEFDIALY
ncbi:hypothetical protein Asppvi_010752 [Aspergillus pseudoviridinutans]|uniref:Uncharacterized protein n=1 Tax=Aspergillus pseudoviridinutans TaxID=1517512 RepID=A0A9P3EXB2_9EURO|nr:uncharacterized protein Asppvi_010752 [Aspergillus pseudoviridinutans]GIJ91779.1 hypothetical protein Asppvi_010752 [Aspergillus pseudoviridinutans]